MEEGWGNRLAIVLPFFVLRVRKQIGRWQCCNHNHDDDKIENNLKQTKKEIMLTVVDIQN